VFLSVTALYNYDGGVTVALFNFRITSFLFSARRIKALNVLEHERQRRLGYDWNLLNFKMKKQLALRIRVAIFEFQTFPSNDDEFNT